MHAHRCLVVLTRRRREAEPAEVAEVDLDVAGVCERGTRRRRQMPVSPPAGARVLARAGHRPGGGAKHLVGNGWYLLRMPVPRGGDAAAPESWNPAAGPRR